MEKLPEQQHFQQLVVEAKTMIREAQFRALQVVNRELINLYLSLGKLILERQKKYDWGRSVVDHLSTELRNEFPDQSGYSSRNLWLMRGFYLEFHQNEFLQPLVAEIGWSKNIVIFTQCKDNLQREFYLRMTQKFGWTKAVLIHHIENCSYEKYLTDRKSVV